MVNRCLKEDSGMDMVYVKRKRIFSSLNSKSKEMQKRFADSNREALLFIFSFILDMPLYPKTVELRVIDSCLVINYMT